MRRASTLIALAMLLVSSTAAAGNSDEVNAGVEVTLTGGAVVANVTSGAALWYNPAGLARIAEGSFEITGVTFQTSIVRYPGLLTLETGEQSKGKTTNLSLIPEALTFTFVLEKMMLGFGIFNSSLRRDLVQEEVASSPGVTPSSVWRGAVNSRIDFVHISTGLATEFGKRKQKVLFGGAFDIVVGTSRIDQLLAGFYDDGAAGALSQSSLETQAGFGVQLKAGLQWVPIPEVRVGFSLATPSYMFMLAERLTAAANETPPFGSAEPPQATSEQTRRVRGGWFGAEPGTLRTGVVYIGGWGWIEGDLVVDFRLKSSRFLFNNKTVANGRVGTVFDVSKHFKLGLGAFTDLSQTNELINIGDRQVDFFGVNVGFLFSSQETRPDAEKSEADKDKTSVALAIGIRYSYGRGNVLGAFLPAVYDPAAIELRPVATKINDIDFNFGVKVLF